MPIKYTRAEIIRKIEDAVKDGMSEFYQKKFINYTGTTSDTKEYYTEIIAEWCCNHKELFSDIKKIKREESYKISTHDGITERDFSNRIEERTAMAMFRQGELPLLGKVEDYQTPLKNKQKDQAGKIDLLTYDGKVLRILELKAAGNTETMLRCVLEGYTYLCTVSEKDLLSSFDLPENTEVLTSPLVPFEGVQYEEMQRECPHLKMLMELWNIVPYYFAESENGYIVTKG